MNGYEEEMQNNVEAGKNSDDNNVDAKAYQIVFNALKREPSQMLSSSFADKVVARAIEKQKSKKLITEYFWFAAGITLLLAASVFTIVLTDFKLNFGFLNALSSYKGLIIFATCFIVILNIIDKRLVKHSDN